MPWPIEWERALRRAYASLQEVIGGGRHVRSSAERRFLVIGLTIVALATATLAVMMARNGGGTGPAAIPPPVNAADGQTGEPPVSVEPEPDPGSPSADPGEPDEQDRPGGEGEPPGTPPEEEDEDEGGPVTAPVDGRQAATFNLVEAADEVDVRTADLGGDLFRVDSAQAARPSADVNGDEVRVTPARGDGVNRTTVLLNSGVRWSVRMSAGVRRGSFDLDSGRVDSVTLQTSGVLEVSLPRPDGTLPLEFRGRVGTARVSMPDVPARVALRRGAGVAVVNGATDFGVRPGTTVTPADFAAAADRVDIVTEGGVGTIRVSSA